MVDEGRVVLKLVVLALLVAGVGLLVQPVRHPPASLRRQRPNQILKTSAVGMGPSGDFAFSMEFQHYTVAKEAPEAVEVIGDMDCVLETGDVMLHGHCTGGSK